MKSYNIYTLFLAFYLILSTVSCKKDKDLPLENFMKFDGKTYALENGLLEYYGQVTGTGYNFDLFLYTRGLTFIPYSGLSGKGSMLFMEIYTEGSQGLSAGTYDFDIGGSGEAFTFENIQMVKDLNTDDKTGTVTYFTSGSIVIADSTEGYLFDITVTTTGGKTLTAHFKGEPTVIDMSGKK